MKAQQIQKKVEGFHYWDARVLELKSEYFGDEVTLVFEDSEGNVKILFSGCTKVCFITSMSDRETPLKELKLPQIPYFIQDIEVTDCVQDEREVLKCMINMPPLSVEICCRSISACKEK